MIPRRETRTLQELATCSRCTGPKSPPRPNPWGTDTRRTYCRLLPSPLSRGAVSILSTPAGGLLLDRLIRRSGRPVAPRSPDWDRDADRDRDRLSSFGLVSGDRATPPRPS
jgi:hypothetical protein